MAISSKHPNSEEFMSHPKKSRQKHVEMKGKDRNGTFRRAELKNRPDMGRKVKSPHKNIVTVPSP